MTGWRNRIVGSGEEEPGQLLANPRNWRIHPKGQQAAMNGALDEVGWVTGVIVNKRTGFVVDGHLRVSLAISHGETSVPVQYVDLTEREEAIVLASLDPISAMAGRDDSIFAELVSGLEVGDSALAHLLATGEPKAGLTDPDAIPEAVEPITKPGDLWLLGEHRLLCGDSTKVNDVTIAIGRGDSREPFPLPSLMVTDPPYGVSVAGGTHDPRDAKNYRSGGTIQNDGLTGTALTGFLSGVFEIAKDALSPGAAWYVFYAGTESRAVLAAAEALGGMRHVLVWVKPNFVFGRSDYHYRHEPIMYGWTDGAAHRWLGSRDQDSVWEAGADGTIERKQHPTAKPVAIVSRPIANHTLPGDAVYDPFLGSGTTLIACEQLGRRCYAIEIEPKYVDVAVKRWEQFTGREAVRDGSG